MLAAALRAEVAAYIDQFAGVRDEDGRRLVVRNGSAGPRTVLTSAGAVEVSAPRVNDKALAEIWNAEDKDHARAAVRAFAATYGAKFPKAAAKVTGDEEELLAFYDYPAEHWVHLRMTNDRVDLRHGAAADEGHQGPRVEGRRAGDGVQADRVCAAALAAAPGRPKFTAARR
jgi:uncharacterized protein YdaU (DUF1376 family)